MSSTPAKILGVLLGLAILAGLILLILFLAGVIGGSDTPPDSSTEPDIGGAVTAPAPMVDQKYNYVGDGECTNDVAPAAAKCRAQVGCDVIGQQSNGCWHLLQKSSTGTLAAGSYPKGIKNLTDLAPMVDQKYNYVGDGECTNDVAPAAAKCRAQVGCDVIGQQSNGCWHLLQKSSTGTLAAGSYPKGIKNLTDINVPPR